MPATISFIEQGNCDRSNEFGLLIITMMPFVFKFCQKLNLKNTNQFDKRINWYQLCENLVEYLFNLNASPSKKIILILNF